jgi:hypothetical protein
MLAGNLPVNVDLRIRQGTTWPKTITIKQDGVAVDYLDGYTARMQIRASVDADEPLLTLTTENGRIAINAELGQIGLRLEVADTTALESGVYDLEIIAPSGEVTSLMAGTVRVSPEVTR